VAQRSYCTYEPQKKTIFSPQKTPDFHDLRGPLQQNFHTDSENNLKIIKKSKVCHAGWLPAQLTGWLAAPVAAQPAKALSKIKV
jgi:hypothetical protein